MTTYYSESFFRWQISDKITSSQACPFTIRISKTPSISNWLLTISPDTENEEIVEYETTVNPNEISIIKRWIKPSATSLLNAWVDYNNTSFMKSHAIWDLIRWDVNHIHLNQVISIAAWITPNSIYDAVVSPSWGTHTTLASAIADGKENIIIRGSVTEPSSSWVSLSKSINIWFAPSASIFFGIGNNAYAFNCNAYDLNVYWGSITFQTTSGTAGLVKGNNVNFYWTTFSLNRASTSRHFTLAAQESSWVRKFSNCVFTITTTWGTTNINYGLSNTSTIYSNCVFTINATTAEMTAQTNVRFDNCTITATVDQASRFAWISSKITNCVINVGWDVWVDDGAYVANTVFNSTLRTWGSSHILKGNIVSSSFSTIDTSWGWTDSTTTTISGCIITWCRSFVVTWNFTWNRFISSNYAWAAIFSVAGWVATWNYINTKWALAWSGTITWVFVGNIATDDAGTFTTSWAWVIANNQLS